MLHGFECHALGYDHIRYAEPLHDSPLNQTKCCSPREHVYHDSQMSLKTSPYLLRPLRVPLLCFRQLYDPSVEQINSTEC